MQANTRVVIDDAFTAIADGGSRVSSLFDRVNAAVSAVISKKIFRRVLELALISYPVFYAVFMVYATMIGHVRTRVFHTRDRFLTLHCRA